MKSRSKMDTQPRGLKHHFVFRSGMTSKSIKMNTGWTQIVTHFCVPEWRGNRSKTASGMTNHKFVLRSEKEGKSNKNGHWAQIAILFCVPEWTGNRLKTATGRTETVIFFCFRNGVEIDQKRSLKSSRFAFNCVHGEKFGQNR